MLSFFGFYYLIGWTGRRLARVDPDEYFPIWALASLVGLFRGKNLSHPGLVLAICLAAFGFHFLSTLFSSSVLLTLVVFGVSFDFSSDPEIYLCFFPGIVLKSPGGLSFKDIAKFVGPDKTADLVLARAGGDEEERKKDEKHAREMVREKQGERFRVAEIKQIQEKNKALAE